MNRENPHAKPEAEGPNPIPTGSRFDIETESYVAGWPPTPTVTESTKRASQKISERDRNKEETFDVERALQIESAATKVFIAIWRGITERGLPERGPIADAALNLRDALNPDWPSNPDWLPEPLSSERLGNS